MGKRQVPVTRGLGTMALGEWEELLAAKNPSLRAEGIEYRPLIKNGHLTGVRGKLKIAEPDREGAGVVPPTPSV